MTDTQELVVPRSIPMTGPANEMRSVLSSKEGRRTVNFGIHIPRDEVTRNML